MTLSVFVSFCQHGVKLQELGEELDLCTGYGSLKSKVKKVHGIFARTESVDSITNIRIP